MPVPAVCPRAAEASLMTSVERHIEFEPTLGIGCELCGRPGSIALADAAAQSILAIASTRCEDCRGLCSRCRQEPESGVLYLIEGGALCMGCLIPRRECA